VAAQQVQTLVVNEVGCRLPDQPGSILLNNAICRFICASVAVPEVLNCQPRLRQLLSTVLLGVPFVWASLPVGIATADWQIGLEGGTVVSSSNGSTTRIRLRLDSFDRPLSQSIRLDWYSNSATDDAYEITYAPRYWLSDDTYGFGKASWLVDNSPGIDGQGLLLAGAGREFIATDTTRVIGEVGAGLRFTRFDAQNSLDESSDEEPVGTARLAAAHRVQDVAQLLIDADFEAGETSTRLQSEVGVALLLPQGAIKVSYRHVRRDADGFETFSEGETFVSVDYRI